MELNLDLIIVFIKNNALYNLTKSESIKWMNEFLNSPYNKKTMDRVKEEQQQKIIKEQTNKKTSYKLQNVKNRKFSKRYCRSSMYIHN